MSFPIPTVLLAAIATVAAGASAQNHYLFSVSRPAPTLSGSGSTALERLWPNEIHEFHATSACPTNSSEKWAPRTAFHTLAGDEDNDDDYWEPMMFGEIDAILAPLFSGPANLRTAYFSPSVDMGNCVSGGAGLRAGDVGRIVRNGAGDGQVEYFIRAEQVQMALGLPPAPLVVNVDAIAAQPNYGVFFSLENDHFGFPTVCGPINSRDGDVWMIPPSALTWGPNMEVAAVVPGGAERVYTESQINTFVVNAQVTDRFGACVTQIIDTDALEIDFTAPGTASHVSCTGVTYPLPILIFAGESLTGPSLLDTASGGRIRPSPCGALGTSCGGGATLGNRFGIRPFSPTVGWDTSINGISLTRTQRFVTESPMPVKSIPNSFDIHVGSPGPFTWVFAKLAPSGPCAVAPSLPFGSGFMFPDVYVSGGVFMGFVPTGTGFGTYTSPVLGFPADIVWQGVTVVGSTIQLSTPTTTELF